MLKDLIRKRIQILFEEDIAESPGALKVNKDWLDWMTRARYSHQ